jgi:hypothetical protein
MERGRIAKPEDAPCGGRSFLSGGPCGLQLGHYGRHMSAPEAQVAREQPHPREYSPEARKLINEIVNRAPLPVEYEEKEPRLAEALGAVRTLGNPTDTAELEAEYLRVVHQADNQRWRDERDAARQAGKMRDLDLLSAEVQGIKKATASGCMLPVTLTLIVVVTSLVLSLT